MSRRTRIPTGLTKALYGRYNFSSKNTCPEIVTAEKTAQQFLHKLYCKVLDKDFTHSNLNADEKEKLAEAVRYGLIVRNGDIYKPNFVIFTKEQLDKLHNEIFMPLLPEIEPKLKDLAKQFYKLHKADFPQAKQNLIEHHTTIDLMSFGIFAFIFAAENNKLYLPETPEEGVPLTLILVK